MRARILCLNWRTSLYMQWYVQFCLRSLHHLQQIHAKHTCIIHCIKTIIYEPKIPALTFKNLQIVSTDQMIWKCHFESAIFSRSRAGVCVCEGWGVGWVCGCVFLNYVFCFALFCFLLLTWTCTLYHSCKHWGWTSVRKLRKKIRDVFNFVNFTYLRHLSLYPVGYPGQTDLDGCSIELPMVF